MMAVVEDENISAMALLIKRSITFADWAAGEGISPSLTGEGTAEDLDPGNFLYAYSQVTGDEDWLSLASRISKAFEELKAENFELRQQLFLTAEKLTREGVEEIRSEIEERKENSSFVPVPEKGTIVPLVSVPVELLINLWCELYYGVGGEFGIDDSISQWNLDRVVDLLASVDALPVPQLGELVSRENRVRND